jgi:hypothetical protein
VKHAFSDTDSILRVLRGGDDIAVGRGGPGDGVDGIDIRQMDLLDGVGNPIVSGGTINAVEGAGKVRTQADLDALASDPAHGGKIGAKSIAEREVGLGIEAQGKVNSIVRDPSGSAEFIDSLTGQKWDVKAFNSQYAPKGYNLTDAMANINNSLANGENVMLDTRNLNAVDLHELTSEIEKQGMSSNVLLWP